MELGVFKLKRSVDKSVDRFDRREPETACVGRRASMGELRKVNALHEPLQRLMGLLLQQVRTNVHYHSYRKKLDHFHPATTGISLGEDSIPKYDHIIQMKVAAKH